MFQALASCRGVARYIDEETAARIARGEATVADLYTAAHILGWSLGDLLPGSVGELHGPPHDLQRRDAESAAQRDELMHVG